MKTELFLVSYRYRTTTGHRAVSCAVEAKTASEAKDIILGKFKGIDVSRVRVVKLKVVRK
jgi:hypothetical protein